MNKKVSLALVAMCLISFSAYADSWNGRIFRASDLQEINKATLFQELAPSQQIVLGEKHYTPAVQLAQAEVIQGVVEVTGRRGQFTTGWEFLTASEQTMIRAAYQKFVDGEWTAKQIIAMTQGDSPDNDSYVPLFEVTKAYGGQFIATNLSREEVRPVARYGLGAADPSLIPPGFEMGSQGYHDRFAEFMGGTGHATPEMIENYYAAQCLKDDVMAYHLINTTADSLKFLIVGSFHSDYLDGVTARLKARSPELTTATVRLIDASDYYETELMPELRSNRWGNLADYVIFVNEPATPESLLGLLRTKRLYNLESLGF